MRSTFALLAATLLFAASLASQSTVVPAATTASKGVSGQLVATYQRMLDGIVSVDTIALSNVLSSAYTWTPSNDSTSYTRSQRFAKMVASKDRLDSLYVRNCRIALYPTSAVGNCRVGQRGHFGNAGTGHSEVLSTVMFVKESQGWRIAATHTMITELPSHDSTP